MNLLRPGTRLRQMAVRCGSMSSVAWEPDALSGLAVTLLPALARSQGKLWQDSGKTVAASANNDPVRVAVCPFTALEWAAPSDAARPLLKDDTGGKWSLAFDGTDDRMAISTLNKVGTAPGVTLYVRYFGLAASAKGLVFKDGGAGDGYGWAVGDANGDNVGANLLALREAMVWVTGLGTHQQSGTLTATASTTAGTSFWRDGALGGTNATNVVPPGGINAATSGVSVGGSTTGTRFFAGRVAGLGYYSAIHGASDRLAAETYFGALA